jgi:mono/diheme cytochrome c family protein
VPPLSVPQLAADGKAMATAHNLFQNNCAQCHGAAAATFARPSASFSIVGLPAAHIPTSASCTSSTVLMKCVCPRMKLVVYLL